MVVEMKVMGLSLDEATKAPILVLKQREGDDVLPIWIGAMEAMAISLALNDVETPRPLTHDLLLTSLAAMGAKLVAVNVVDLREGTYFAELEIIQGETTVRVDSRPSDAVALALRAEAPIMVSSEVLQKAGDERLRPMHGDPALLKSPSDAAAALLKQDGTPSPAGDASEDELEELLRKLEPVTKYKM
ncbi:bifunctional nuclease family protein [Oleidesulfovibrio sp.]|uniref:bifunctional nuclease family protein n=1 Tax=Oleidesulfovibrio sp. TaxID=2909707 RepID=UPI003A8B282C